MCTGEPVNVARRQLLEEGGPLIPAAVNGQHQFEAALLPIIKAASAEFARDRRPGWTGAAVKETRLRTDSLSLHVADEVLDRVLAAALPVATSSGLRGIPGLRPEAGRDFLDLNVVDTDGDRTGHIRLLGVAPRRWRSLQQQLERRQQRPEPVWKRRTGLHDAEWRSLDNAATAPTDLMSAVLRRFPLWRHSAWLDSAVDNGGLRVRWQHGLPDEVVIAILTESLCRIPGVTAVREQLSDQMRSILLSYAEVAANTSHEDAWAWVQLQALDLAASAALDSTEFALLPEVWDHQEMRDALARREISLVYRLLRRHGVSAEQISALTGQSTAEVAEVLQGRQTMAWDALSQIARGLGVPRGYMGLAYDELIAVRLAKESEAPKLAPKVDSSESEKRRKFLAHAAAVTVGVTAFGGSSWASSPTSTSSPSHIGTGDVRQVEAAVRALRSLKDNYGAGSGHDAVLAQLSWARGMLKSKASQKTRQRLQIALAELHDLAGCMAFENGLRTSALEHFTRSRDLVRLSQEEGLIAGVLDRLGGGRLVIAGDHRPGAGQLRVEQGSHLGPRVKEAWRAARDTFGPQFSLHDLLNSDEGVDFLR
ncbi:hypothetical protein GCM10011609_49340 [Lentzea pudingi]|uniref:HTH cro/C1-type domain-containing protein n=1 Tax=Lentzea pudingi TaxID=1789439 RepID=A0ABQ2ICJ5_9PSEU|nr:hypothetical protein [Lentzea pudingi]GGN04243.1 hypothetical protein GCM10011609_49340 [Lentzea pudingi]